jgi:hypothetical protein
VLLVGKTIVLEALFAFRYGEIIVIGTGSFHVKKVGAFAGFYFFGENFFSTACLVFFHNPSILVLGLTFSYLKIILCEIIAKLTSKNSLA